jgi:hypothetical protein
MKRIQGKTSEEKNGKQWTPHGFYARRLLAIKKLLKFPEENFSERCRTSLLLTAGATQQQHVLGGRRSKRFKKLAGSVNQLTGDRQTNYGMR